MDKTMDSMAVFGRNVKRLRVRAGHTQETLARIVGVSRSTLANIEAGRKYTTNRIEIRLAESLGVGVAELWKEGE